MDKMDKSDVSTDRIPSLIKIGAIPSEYGQKLHTDVIDPSTFSQRRVRFTLSRVAGFLHSNSKVTLAVTPLAGVSKGFYPLNVGVSQLIQTAQLSIGNQVVCSVDDYNQFHAYQSMFISNEDNKEREQFLSQRCISHMPVYDDRTANVTDKPPNSAKKIGLDVGRNPVVAAAGGAGAFELLPFMHQDGTSAQTISEAPVYSVYLSDLFPFLKFNQLPMFMLDQEVHIDLTFVDATTSLSGGVKSQRLCVNGGTGGAGDESAFQVDESECKLIYDSITYDGDIMEKYAQQNPKLTFQYADYRLTKRTGVKNAGAGTDDFASLVLPVGANGRLCSKVIFGLQSNANFVSKSLLNGTTAHGDNGLAYNLLYNDRFEFNVDRANSALQFSTTQAAEGQVPMVTHDEIVKRSTVSSITDETMEGLIQGAIGTGVEELFRWNSIRPNKGERVNSKGMDLHYKIATGLADGTYTLRVYVELLKVATIEGGRFACYFA